MTEPKPKSKSKTLLTGEIDPNPDLVINLREGADRGRLFETKTIGDCIVLLKEILPYWTARDFTKHESNAKRLLVSIRAWLVMLRAKSNREIPQIPSDLFGIQDWILDAERALEKKEEKDWSKVSPLTKALVVLHDDPDLSVSAIADEIGVRRQRLYEMPDFMAARQIFKEAQLKSRYNAKPKGSKDRKTGKIEACLD